MKNNDTIYNKYIIIKKIGSGGQATCYLVRKYGENINYVAKMVENLEDAENEIKLNKIIASAKTPIPYVIKLIDDGNGDFIRGEKHLKNQRYFILEYASKEDLYKYIDIPKSGFGEDCGKLLFYKILLGIQGCHEAGIYHLDLKIENIVVDQNYDPKISDFGLGTNDSGILTSSRGTRSYQPPQIIEGNPYKGETKDIFCLGIMLFIIVVGLPCFISANKNDNFYSQIMNNDLPEYFNRLQEQIKSFDKLSKEFKDLFVSMLAYEENKRPKIKTIMEDKWFDDLRNVEKKKKIEKELNDMFIEKEKKVIKYMQDNPEYEKKKREGTFGGNRSSNEDIKDIKEEIFPHNLIPKSKNIELGMDAYIKIKGDLDHYTFMNILVNKIKNEFKNDNYFFDKSDKKYECKFIFEKEDEDEEKKLELNLNNLADKKKVCVIQLKLFKFGEKEYVLRFLRKSGSLSEYYSKVTKMVEIAKKLV